MSRGQTLKPERKALLDQCVEDGWPLVQIIRTHGFGTRTIKKHYPEYKGMSLSEAGKLAMAIRHADLKLQRMTA